MSVEGRSDDTPLTSYDTHLFSLLILLVHISKFNIDDTLMTLPLRFTLFAVLVLVAGAGVV